MGWEHDFITPIGIEYRLDYGITTFTADEIEYNLQLMAECMGYPVPDNNSLMIVITDKAGLDTIGATSGSWGVFRSYPNLIGLWGGTHSNEDFRVNHTMKHEFLHYLLYINNGHADDGHHNTQAKACLNGYD